MFTIITSIIVKHTVNVVETSSTSSTSSIPSTTLSSHRQHRRHQHRLPPAWSSLGGRSGSHCRHQRHERHEHPERHQPFASVTGVTNIGRQLGAHRCSGSVNETWHWRCSLVPARLWAAHTLILLDRGSEEKIPRALAGRPPVEGSKTISQTSFPEIVVRSSSAAATASTIGQCRSMRFFALVSSQLRSAEVSSPSRVLARPSHDLRLAPSVAREDRMPEEIGEQRAALPR